MSNQYQARCFVSQSQYSLLVLHAKVRRRVHKSPLLQATLPYSSLNIYLLLIYRSIIIIIIIYLSWRWATC